MVSTRSQRKLQEFQRGAVSPSLSAPADNSKLGTKRKRNRYSETAEMGPRKKATNHYSSSTGLSASPGVASSQIPAALSQMISSATVAGADPVCDQKLSLSNSQFQIKVQQPNPACEQANSPTSTLPTLSTEVREALLEVQKGKVKIEWLHEERVKAHQKFKRKEVVLVDLIRPQFPEELNLETRISRYKPKNEQEKQLKWRHLDLESFIGSIRTQITSVQRSIDNSKRTLCVFMLDTYSKELVSEKDLRRGFGTVREDDYSSNEDDSPRTKPLSEVCVKIGDPNSREPQNSAIEPNPPHLNHNNQRSEPADLAHLNDQPSPAPSLQASQSSEFEAIMGRRRAREELYFEQDRFDEFWCSFEEYKRLFHRQRTFPNGVDTLTEWAREWFVRGQNKTQRLAQAEQYYNRAARHAQELNIPYLSPAQSSLFPSDDGVDVNGYEQNVQQARDRMDEEKILRWIRDDWMSGDPNTFEDPETLLDKDGQDDASPIVDTAGTKTTGDLVQIDIVIPTNPNANPDSEIPYGHDPESHASGKRRLHIDAWNVRRGQAMRTMRLQWEDLKSERWGVPDGQPPSPRDDEVRLSVVEGEPGVL